MKRFLCILIILSSAIIYSYSQPWNVEWEKNFKIDGVSMFCDAIPVQEGGYTLLGAVKKTKQTIFDFWLIRLAESGDTIWTQTYKFEEPRIPGCLVQTTDGSYLIAAIGEEQMKLPPVILKTDSLGNEIWRKTPNGAGTCKGGKMISLDNGGFLVATGRSNEGEQDELWLAGFDAEGEKVWEKTFTEDEEVVVKSLKQLPDGSFAIGARVSERGKYSSDTWILRTNPRGEKIWSSRISNAEARSWPECICCSSDNNLMVVGWHGTAFTDINSENPIMDFDLSVLEFDKDGKVVLTKNIDSEGSEGGNHISSCPDGTFLVAGKKETSFTGKIGPWLIHLGKNGEILSEKLIPFHFNNDQAAKVIPATDGGFVVIGPGIQSPENSRSFAWVCKYSAL